MLKMNNHFNKTKKSCSSNLNRLLSFCHLGIIDFILWNWRACVDFKVPSALDGDTRDHRALFQNTFQSLTQNNLRRAALVSRRTHLPHFVIRKVKRSCSLLSRAAAPPPHTLWGAHFLPHLFSTRRRWVHRTRLISNFFIRKFEELSRPEQVIWGPPYTLYIWRGKWYLVYVRARWESEQGVWAIYFVPLAFALLWWGARFLMPKLITRMICILAPRSRKAFFGGWPSRGIFFVIYCN